MDLNVTELNDLNDGVEDVGTIDEKGLFTAATPKQEQKPLGSRVPQPRITTMAYKNRGSLANNVTPPPPRKVTYDDILSSLNMKVVDGKLQISRNVAVENIKTNNFSSNIAPTTQTKNLFQSQQQKQAGLTKNKVFDQMRQQMFQQQQQQMFQQQQQQMFQQQQQQLFQQQQTPDVPIMSKQQYRQMVAANYLKTLEQQQRIKNMKSTKMIFSNSNIGISPILAKNGGSDLNRLFRFGK